VCFGASSGSVPAFDIMLLAQEDRCTQPGRRSTYAAKREDLVAMAATCSVSCARRSSATAQQFALKNADAPRAGDRGRRQARQSASVRLNAVEQRTGIATRPRRAEQSVTATHASCGPCRKRRCVAQARIDALSEHRDEEAHGRRLFRAGESDYRSR
jgi:hypothetical protein